jgi:Ca2+/H+ antiporter
VLDKHACAAASTLLISAVSVCAAVVHQDESESDLSLPTACAGLCLVTLAVSGHSELLVDSIDGFTAEANLSKTFVVSAHAAMS